MLGMTKSFIAHNFEYFDKAKDQIKLILSLVHLEI